MSEGAIELAKAIGAIGIVLVALFAVGAIIVSFFNDRLNCLLLIGFCVMNIIFLIPYILGSDNSVDGKAALCGLVFGGWVFARFLPTLSTRTETSTYLIYGTLLESSETKVIGLGISLFVSAVIGVGLGFLTNFAVTNAKEWISIYLVNCVLGVYTIIVFIKSFFN